MHSRLRSSVVRCFSPQFEVYSEGGLKHRTTSGAKKIRVSGYTLTPAPVHALGRFDVNRHIRDVQRRMQQRIRNSVGNHVALAHR